MRDITIVDYIGNCDKKGQATGHVLKTINEAVDILKDLLKIQLIVTDDYAKYFTKDIIKYSLHISSRINYKNNIFSKYIFRVQKIRNIRHLLKNEKKLWFINTDFWLFFVLMLYRKNIDQKIYVTNYIDYYTRDSFIQKIKNYIYIKAMKNVEKVFITNYKMVDNKHVYIPDYYYNPEKCKEYLIENKEKWVYMCGGMNEAKDIEGLINAFNINKQKLIIKGNFSSDNQYIEVKKEAGQNIEIHNKRLNYKEYYSNIAKSLFVILPYKRAHYNNRSSGVILEAIFLESIVIAPQFLLDQLGIYGIGYTSIDELERFSIERVTVNEINDIRFNNKKMLKKYSYKSIVKEYMNAFEIE